MRAAARRRSGVHADRRNIAVYHERQVNDAKRDFVEALREARATGATLRMIADAAGVSHEQVRLMLRTRGVEGED